MKDSNKTEAKLAGLAAKTVTYAFGNTFLAEEVGYAVKKEIEAGQQRDKAQIENMAKRYPVSRPNAAPKTSSSKADAVTQKQRDAMRGRPKIVIPD